VSASRRPRRPAHGGRDDPSRRREFDARGWLNRMSRMGGSARVGPAIPGDDRRPFADASSARRVAGRGGPRGNRGQRSSPAARTGQPCRHFAYPTAIPVGRLARIRPGAEGRFRDRVTTRPGMIFPEQRTICSPCPGCPPTGCAGSRRVRRPACPARRFSCGTAAGASMRVTGASTLSASNRPCAPSR